MFAKKLFRFSQMVEWSNLANHAHPITTSGLLTLSKILRETLKIMQYSLHNRSFNAIIPASLTFRFLLECKDTLVKSRAIVSAVVDKLHPLHAPLLPTGSLLQVHEVP